VNGNLSGFHRAFIRFPLLAIGPFPRILDDGCCRRHAVILGGFLGDFEWANY
jgi:hypothetical protein